MCSTHSFRPTTSVIINDNTSDRPHTAEELRKMKEELDNLKARHLTEEEQLIKEILKAQDKIRKDIDQKRAQKLAAAAMEDEAWVFEKSANGWI